MNEFFLGIIEITAGMSLLILVMLLGLKFIGGKFTAKCRYILWTLVMIRLAVPLSFGILPALIEVPVETEPDPVQIQMQVPTSDYTPMPQNPVTIPTQEPVQMPSPLVQTPVFTEPELEPITWDDVKAYIPHAYLACAAVFLLWNLLSYWIYTAKILRTAREADVETQKIYEFVCRKMELSYPPVLLVSPYVNSPAAFGLIRRRIVLPKIDFTENGLAGTLSHEVTHCRRGDLWIKALCLLARTFHWYNPLVHLAAFRCEMEMELSCDESVLSGCDENTRAAYGEVMLDIIKRCRRNRGALTTHFNPRKNAVKARFTNILYGSGKKRGLWLIAVCLVLCLIAGAIVACRTEVPEEATETAEEAQQRETLLATYELYQTEYNDLQAQLELLDDKYADLTASRAELQTELQTLTTLREDLYTQLAGMPEDSEEALHLRLAIQEYDERIKSHQMAMNGVDAEISLLESQRQTVQEKLQTLADSINDTEAKMRDKDILQENDIAAEDTTNAVTVTSPIYLCDDVYRGDITPTHGESTITFPAGLDGYKLYTCEVLLCGDECDPHDLVYRNYFGYAGGFPLQEREITKNGSYTTGLWLFTYPDEILEQILSDMEKGGASEEEKQAYRNKRAYLYHLTIDEQHCACIFIEPEDMNVRPENEQEILDTLIASVEIDMTSMDTMRMSNLNRHLVYPARWYHEQIGMLGTASGDNLPGVDLIFWLDEYRAYVDSGNGRVWTLEAVPLADFEKTAEHFLTTEGVDVYTTGYGSNRILIGTDSKHAWVLVLPTDVQFLENDPISRENYELLQKESQTVLENFLSQNGITPNPTCPASEVYAPRNMTVSVPVDPAAIWQTFLDTVVAPYKNYLASYEFLDLDGNGITELILYDLGMGVGEIFTIEGGEVRSLYTGDNILTHYSDDRKALAPPSLGAGEYVFYASGTPEDVTKTRYKNWFVPSPKTGGYVLYSSYGNTVSRNDEYYYFYSGENSVLGKFLCVAQLPRFELEAINSNPALGWECWYEGEKVTKKQYFAHLESCWDTLEDRYGVTYNEENTNHYLDELQKTPTNAFELLADLLDTLRTDDPQAYLSRTPLGEADSKILHPAWGFYDDNMFAENLAVEYTFEPLTAMEVQETTRFTLHSVPGGQWTIHTWVNSNYIELILGKESYFFRAAYKDNSEINFGDTLKDWFDDAEYAATPYQAVIPDTGHGFLAAAQTFVESWYGRNLQVSSGSEHAFSYVSCSVRDAQNRDHLIENGFIGENTYTYYITVIFVGENPHAGRGIKATIAGLYSGEDPTVPHNAYEFQLNGYITLEEDGWHGEVGGTGW